MSIEISGVKGIILREAAAIGLLLLGCTPTVPSSPPDGYIKESGCKISRYAPDIFMISGCQVRSGAEGEDAKQAAIIAINRRCKVRSIFEAAYMPGRRLIVVDDGNCIPELPQK